MKTGRVAGVERERPHARRTTTYLRDYDNANSLTERTPAGPDSLTELGSLTAATHLPHTLNVYSIRT